MALITDKSVFLHAPKCGGWWVRKIFKAANIPHHEVGHEHSHFPELLQYHPIEFYKRRLIFTFIRHPLSWYQSRWTFRMKTGWEMSHPLDFACSSNNFQTFINNVLKFQPGWFTSECGNYIRNTDRVGRLENLVSDMQSILEAAGEKFDPAILRTIHRLNDSDMDGKPSKYWAQYTPELAEKVLFSERSIVERFYKDYHA